MHLLALRVSTFLSMKPGVVLKHWACAKIVHSRPTTTGGQGDTAELGGIADDDVCKLIVDKFKQFAGSDVSYAEIAKKAWEVGRSGLATKVSLSPDVHSIVVYQSCFVQLLDYESRASDQVPLLLNMKEDRLALQKAVDSGDTDLGEKPRPLPRVDPRLILSPFVQFITSFSICITDFLWGLFSNSSKMEDKSSPQPANYCRSMLENRIGKC